MSRTPAYPVDLQPNSSEWTVLAVREVERLTAALGEHLSNVHHVGSTAVPGIRAKPIVDMLAEVTSLAALDAAEDLMRGLRYDWRGEFGVSGRRFCTLDDAATGRRLVHLHCYAAGAGGGAAPGVRGPLAHPARAGHGVRGREAALPRAVAGRPPGIGGGEIGLDRGHRAGCPHHSRDREG